MSVANPIRTRWSGWAVLASLLLLPVAGCTNPHPAEGEGSWLEILEIEEQPNALEVEALPSFRAVEVLDDRLIFTFEGESPLHVDHVVGGSGQGTRGYLRRVVAVNTLADGRVEAMTVQADIVEYYKKLNFIFHYNPRQVQEPHYVDLGDVGGASEAETSASCDDISPCQVSGERSWGDDTAGCSASASGSINLSPFVETDFNADFHFDLHEDWGLPPSIDPDAYAELQGEVRAGVRFSGSAGAQLMCNADFAALLGGGEAPEITLATFMVGPVPVSVTATPVLEGDLTVSGDVGEFSAEAGVVATADVEFGVKSSEPHYSQEFTFDKFADVTTSRAGSLSASGSIQAGVEVAFQVGYDFGLGPAEVEATVSATMALVGTLGVEMDADIQGCGWTVDIPWSCGVELGVEARIGASVDLGWFGEHELEAFDIDEVLYENPELFGSGSLGMLSGELPWCGMSPSMCTEGGATCHDDAYDNSVCEGMMGFQSCGGGQVQYCTCTAGGWTDCGACMAI